MRAVARDAGSGAVTSGLARAVRAVSFAACVHGFVRSPVQPEKIMLTDLRRTVVQLCLVTGLATGPACLAGGWEDRFLEPVVRGLIARDATQTFVGSLSAEYATTVLAPEGASLAGSSASTRSIELRLGPEGERRLDSRFSTTDAPLVVCTAGAQSWMVFLSTSVIVAGPWPIPVNADGEVRTIANQASEIEHFRGQLVGYRLPRDQGFRVTSIGSGDPDRFTAEIHVPTADPEQARTHLIEWRISKSLNIPVIAQVSTLWPDGRLGSTVFEDHIRAGSAVIPERVTSSSPSAGRKHAVVGRLRLVGHNAARTEAALAELTNAFALPFGHAGPPWDVLMLRDYRDGGAEPRVVMREQDGSGAYRIP
jgi:hypothetical protein